MTHDTHFVGLHKIGVDAAGWSIYTRPISGYIDPRMTTLIPVGLSVACFRDCGSVAYAVFIDCFLARCAQDSELFRKKGKRHLFLAPFQAVIKREHSRAYRVSQQRLVASLEKMREKGYIDRYTSDDVTRTITVDVNEVRLMVH